MWISRTQTKRLIFDHNFKKIIWKHWKLNKWEIFSTVQYINKIPMIFYFRNRSICPILTLLPSKWRHDAGDDEFAELSRIWKLGDRWSQQNWKFISQKNSKFGRSWQNRQNIIGIKFNHVHVILIWVLPYLAQLQAERIMRFIKLKSWLEVDFELFFGKNLIFF